MHTRLLGCLLVLVLLGGCLTQNERTRIHYYNLDRDALSQRRATRTWPVALGVRPFTATSRYRDKILYRSTEFEVGFYQLDRWVEPPEEMVAQVISEMLRAARMFRQVTAADDVSPPAWILGGEVMRFDEIQALEGRQAACWVRFDLQNARTERLLWSEVLRAEVALTENTPEALAAAMSGAVEEIGLQLITQLERAELQSQ